MKKILGLAVLLILLAGGSWILMNNDTANTFDKKGSVFTIKNTDEVNKIVIKDFEGVERELKRFSDGENWVIDGRYFVRPDAMDVLLETLERMTIYAPIPAEAKENVEKSMQNQGRVVWIYEDDKLIKEIIMGAGAPKGNGTYMKVAGQEQAYIVNIPGFNGFLHRRFFTDLEEWRDRTVFNIAAKDIASVSVDYMLHPNHSFTLVNKGNDIEVKSAVNKEDKTVNKLVARQYIGEFEDMYIEAFDNYYSHKDSVLNESPVCKIAVTDKAGKETEMTIYPMFVNERSKSMFDPQGNPLKYDRDHYYALINKDQDFVVIQEYVFGKLFKKYEEFVN